MPRSKSPSIARFFFLPLIAPTFTDRDIQTHTYTLTYMHIHTSKFLKRYLKKKKKSVITFTTVYCLVFY